MKYIQLNYLKLTFETLYDMRRGRTGILNGRQNLILETFEALYGRTLFEPNTPNWEANTQWGIWKVKKVLSEVLVPLSRKQDLHSESPFFNRSDSSYCRFPAQGSQSSLHVFCDTSFLRYIEPDEGDRNKYFFQV